MLQRITAAILWRMRRAVSFFVPQIGVSTARTSAGVISFSPMEPNTGRAYRLMLERQIPASCAPVFHIGSCRAITLSAASEKVGISAAMTRGSRPWFVARRLASAFSRASARVTIGKAPKPILTCLPVKRIFWDHDLENPPRARGLTSRLSPLPPGPSP